MAKLYKEPSNSHFSKKIIFLLIAIIAVVIAFFLGRWSVLEKPSSASSKLNSTASSSSSYTTSSTPPTSTSPLYSSSNSSSSVTSSSSSKANQQTKSKVTSDSKDTMTIVKMPYNDYNKYDLVDLEARYWNVIPKCKVEEVYTADIINCTYSKEGRLEKIKIRLLGIDAPDAKQLNGSTAAKYLRKTIEDKSVAVIHEAKGDRYGRVLGTLYDNGKNINQDLISNGYVFFYPQMTKRDNNSKLFLGYKKDFVKACTSGKGIFYDLTVDSSKIPSTPKQYRDSKSKENWQDNINPLTKEKFKSINELCTYWTIHNR